MMSSVSKRFINALCRNKVLADDQRELYEYALNIFLTGIFHFILSILIGILANMVKESLALFVSFFIIRKFAGGFHTSSPAKCYAFSFAINAIMLFMIHSFTARPNDIVFYSTAAASVFLIILLAPVESPNKPFNEKEKRFFKIMSLALSLLIGAGGSLLYEFASVPIGAAVIAGLATETVVLIPSAFNRIIGGFLKLRSKEQQNY